MTLIRVIDVETDSVEDDAKVIQIGWQDVEADGSDTTALGDAHQMNIATNREISPAAKAVHHIDESDLVLGFVWEDALEVALHPDVDVFAAHNAAFEKKFIDTGRPWICTYKVALHLWPDFESHGNQFLRYKLGYTHDRLKAHPPHHAGPDAYITAMTLLSMLRELTVEEMIDISDRPVLLPRLRFGKHKDTPFKDVPKDYLRWILTQDFDEDVRHTANHWLGRS